MHGTWDKDRITILTAAGELVGQAKLQNGMYCVQTKLDAIPMHSPIAAATINFDDPVWKMAPTTRSSELGKYATAS